jgi:hypothetical protein
MSNGKYTISAAKRAEMTAERLKSESEKHEKIISVGEDGTATVTETRTTTKTYAHEAENEPVPAETVREPTVKSDWAELIAHRQVGWDKMMESGRKNGLFNNGVPQE